MCVFIRVSMSTYVGKCRTHVVVVVVMMVVVVVEIVVVVVVVVMVIVVAVLVVVIVLSMVKVVMVIMVVSLVLMVVTAVSAVVVVVVMVQDKVHHQEPGHTLYHTFSLRLLSYFDFDYVFSRPGSSSPRCTLRSKNRSFLHDIIIHLIVLDINQNLISVLV